MQLDARTGTLSVFGTVDVSDTAAGHTGGTVRLLGEQVGLFDHARVDASGDAGGGTVLIGGDFQGANPEVHNATATFLASDTTVAANAITAGDGGRVVIWSDNSTWFYGTLVAAGGRESGNGGVAEVSGKVWLAFQGHVDLSARGGLGHGGTLLLDPLSLTVTHGGTETDLAGAGGTDDGQANVYAFTEIRP